jgi:cysteine-rich repeat protein
MVRVDLGRGAPGCVVLLWALAWLQPGCVNLIDTSGLEVPPDTVDEGDTVGDPETTSDCATDADCAPTLGEWRACVGATRCGAAGVQTRTRTTQGCVSGTCQAREVTFDTQACEVEAPDNGVSCGDEGEVCRDGECVVVTTCEALDCVGQSRVCDEREAAWADAACGDCVAGYREESGACVQNDCTTDADCAPVAGSWGECGGFAGECGETGTRSRTVSESSCQAGQCRLGAAQTEQESCTRETDGALCSDGGGRCATGVCAVCGDGVVQSGVEACDDGNAVDTDGCRNSCATARCGDGVVRFGVEACDDGNAVDTDGCRNNCQTAVCGDGVVQSGVEACDDGNAVGGDGCTACVPGPVLCPSGVDRNLGVLSDGTFTGTISPATTPDSGAAGCSGSTGGLDVVLAWSPQTSGRYRIDTETSTYDTVLEVRTGCDGPISIACDDDGGTTLGTSSALTVDVVAGQTYRLWLDAFDGPTTTSSGTWVLTITDLGPSTAVCGDGATSGVEECDDGGTVDGDGCSSTCQFEFCGDGVVQPGLGEQCDGAVPVSDTCVTRGFDGGTLSCSATCTVDEGGCTRLPPLGVACTANADCASGFCATAPDGSPNDRCAPSDMVWIAAAPAGTFTMGSPTSEVGRVTNETRHGVTLTRAFFIDRTEVTQGAWKALSGGVNPSCFQSTTGTSCTTSNANDSGPVEQVDWYSALGFANARSAAEGLPACYTLTGCADPTNGWRDGIHTGCAGATFVGLTCTGYRLPTESEWEYAARAGTTTATYVGNLSGTVTGCTTAQVNLDGIAWWCKNSGNRTQAVGGKTANAWGLRDMLGNVREWTWDWYGTYPGTVTDPLGPATGSYRVLRGGYWYGHANYARAAYRNRYVPDRRSYNVGFRLARSLP